MGLASFIMARTLEGIVVILLIVFMPSIPPNIKFTEYRVSPSLPLEGKLALNDRLDNVQKLYVNELKGPEAFADFNGELYTSVQGGDIVKLHGDHIVPIVKFGKPCKGIHEERICGRPLGMAFDKEGMLYVADSYNGIWKVDVKTGKKTQLVSVDKEIEGKKPMIPNSVVISKNGDVYWTDSSSDFKLEDGIYTMLGDGTGRLIHYDSKTKQNKVLMKGIHFANGVALSENEDFIIVAETAQSRLLRYYLKGPKIGTNDVFLDGLPGLPDNLKSDGKDGFLVPLVMARDADHPNIFQIFGPFPLIRKFFARIMGITEASLHLVEKVYPNFYSQTALYWVGNFETFTFGLPARVTVLHVSKDGMILDALHGTDRSMAAISEAHVFKNNLYFGSPWNSYVARLPLSKAGVEHLGKYKEESLKRAERTVELPKAKPAASTEPPKPKPTVAPPTPKPTVAPTTEKRAPPTTTEAPIKKAQATTQQAKKETPPPKVQKTETPKVKQTPPPTAAPKQTQPPTAAPKQTPPTPKQTAPPQKQSPPPTAAPAPKQTPPPVKQAAPTQSTPTKQAPPPATAKQGGVPKTAHEKDAPKKVPENQQEPVVPVKDKVKPKSESIPPK